MDELLSVSGARLGRRRALPGDCVLAAAEEADAPALFALHRDILAEGRWFAAEPEELPPTPAWHAQRIRAARADPTGRSCIRVVRCRRELVGAVLVEGETGRRRRHLARLELFVAQALRGKGLGGALLDAAIAHCRACPQLRKLSLAVFADNAAAVGLYRSRGFVEEGRRRGEYLEADGRLRDDLLMARAV